MLWGQIITHHYLLVTRNHQRPRLILILWYMRRSTDEPYVYLCAFSCTICSLQKLFPQIYLPLLHYANFAGPQRRRGRNRALPDRTIALRAAGGGSHETQINTSTSSGYPRNGRCTHTCVVPEPKLRRLRRNNAALLI